MKFQTSTTVYRLIPWYLYRFKPVSKQEPPDLYLSNRETFFFPSAFVPVNCYLFNFFFPVSKCLGSIMLLCQPLGSVLSGCLQNVLGRKKSMLLVNVPHLAAWYLLYSAESVAVLYVASFIMGIGIGFLEAPTLAYIGEISEPKLRGMLATFANSNVVLGLLLAFTLGCFLNWRMVMLTSCLIPAIAAAAIFMVKNVCYNILSVKLSKMNRILLYSIREYSYTI